LEFERLEQDRYGLHDAAQFSRMFRRRYGIAPSELAAFTALQMIERSAAYAGPAMAVETIKSWFEAL
jgi:AraC-like DNA-binding protein